ncbi:hypothetical protein PM4_222 [Staphylococcus phage PM4]|nr:hypothetical protein PM4_222 [Staphylococcus phage PM4]
MKINYIPMWDNEDVLQYAKSQLLVNELETKEIVFKNYQISDDIDNGTDKNIMKYMKVNFM